VRAGALDRRIVLQRPEATQDEHGEPVTTWVTVAEVAAEVRPLRGVERFAAQQTVARVDTRFRIRWMPGVVPTWRIVFDRRSYDVDAVLEIGRREGFEILAQGRAE
jgi:SPP1 family predicted phage head-tail adaptor